MIYTPLLKILFSYALFNHPISYKKTVYLTFDDGPDPNSTLKFIDLLSKHKIHASFFLVGRQVEKHYKVVEILDQNEHMVCNHSYQHKKSLYLSKNKLYEDILKTKKIISSIVKIPGQYYRPPYGRIVPNTKMVAQQLNLKIVLWDVFVPDFKNSCTAENIKNRIFKYTQKGSIILLHDRSNNTEETLKALPEIITRLRDQGFIFSTLPGL